MNRWLVVFVVLLTLAITDTASLWWRHIPLLSEAVLTHLHFGRTMAAVHIVAGFAVTWLITRRSFGFLGFGGNPVTGIVFGLVATAPLWAPLMALSHVATGTNVTEMVLGASYFPLSEEIFFRAFAFGVLYRVAGLPFWAAAGLTAVPFAAGHLYQAHDVGSAIGTIAITGLGAFIFSWLYAAWNWNLWVPFAFHALMNLFWSLFDVGDGAFAGWAPTAMELGCVALAIALSLYWRRRGHVSWGQSQVAA